jgi:hypothetical protein
MKIGKSMGKTFQDQGFGLWRSIALARGASGSDTDCLEPHCLDSISFCTGMYETSMGSNYRAEPKWGADALYLIKVAL